MALIDRILQETFTLYKDSICRRLAQMAIDIKEHGVEVATNVYEIVVRVLIGCIYTTQSYKEVITNVKRSAQAMREMIQNYPSERQREYYIALHDPSIFNEQNFKEGPYYETLLISDMMTYIIWLVWRLNIIHTDDTSPECAEILYDKTLLHQLADKVFI